MRVLIDGHMIGQNEGGNERYIKNLLISLSKICEVDIIKIQNNILRLIIAPFLMIIKRNNLFHSSYTLPFWKPPGKRYVVTVHDLSFKRFPNIFSTKDKFIFFFLVPYSLWLSDAIIVPSNFTKNELIFFFPQYKNKIFVNHIGVDSIFKPQTKQTISKTDKTRYFLCISSGSSRKNIDFIVRAFLNAKLKNTHLIIIGSHPIFETKIQSCDSIKYLGYVSDKKLNELYNRTQALIYMSAYEGFGLPIIEALACNAPVIASNIPCHKEIADHFVTFVENNNINQLVKAMKKVKKNPRDSSDKIKILYNWAHTAEKMLDIYTKIV